MYLGHELNKQGSAFAFAGVQCLNHPISQPQARPAASSNHYATSFKVFFFKATESYEMLHLLSFPGRYYNTTCFGLNMGYQWTYKV